MSIQIDAFINEITRCFGASPASVVLRRGETKMEYDNTNRGALYRNDDMHGPNSTEAMTGRRRRWSKRSCTGFAAA